MDAILKDTGEKVFILPVDETKLDGCWYIYGNTKRIYDFSDIVFLDNIENYF